LVRLRRAVIDGAADLGGALGDGEPLAQAVDPADAQGGHLPEPESGVGLNEGGSCTELLPEVADKYFQSHGHTDRF
jgi:hypothetical protein